MTTQGQTNGADVGASMTVTGVRRRILRRVRGLLGGAWFTPVVLAGFNGKTLGRVDKLVFNGRSVRVEGWCQSESLFLETRTGQIKITERFPIPDPDPILCLGAQNMAGFRQDLDCTGGVVHLSVPFRGQMFVYELANL